MSKEKITLLIDEMIQMQHQKLFKLGRSIIPYLTEEDLMQPMDFPILEQNSEFRYQEGILQGYHSMRTALLAEETAE